MSETERPFVVGGTKTTSYEAEGATLPEAIEAFRDKFGFVPDGWENLLAEDDHGDIIGLCEGCPRVVLSTERYFSWEDSVVTCESCGGGGPDHKPIEPEEK